MADLLVVTGPSGVGKSTVSRLVVSGVEQSAHVRMDSFLFSVVGGWVDPWRPEATHQNRIVGGAAVAAAMQFIAGGYTVAFDGTVFPDALDELPEACHRREIPLHYVVLRCDLTTCFDRAMARDGERPNAEQFADLHARFSALGAREAHVVDASGTADEVAARVLAAFRSGAIAAA
jgi:thymidylate kinase